MSRLYVFNVVPGMGGGLFGGERAGINIDLNGFVDSEQCRVGYYNKGGSGFYSGAVIALFGVHNEYVLLHNRLLNNSNLSIISAKLEPSSSDTFNYAVPIMFSEAKYNWRTDPQHQYWDRVDWYDEIQCERYGKIPPIILKEEGSSSRYSLPSSEAWVFGGYYRTASYVTLDSCRLTIVTNEISNTIYYDANGGTNTPSPTEVWSDDVVQSVTGTVTSEGVTRPGYNFAGWNTKADGSGTQYSAGDSISYFRDITLYAQWDAKISRLNNIASTEIESSVTISWTKYVTGATHALTITFGNEASGFAGLTGTSRSFTLPSEWYAQTPNSDRGTATVSLTTYVNGASIGTDTKTFTVLVGDSIVPSIGTIYDEKVNSNPAVADWNIYLQNYSRCKVWVAGCAAGTGATIKTYQFAGEGLDIIEQRSGASAAKTSATITSIGTLEYSVTITDSRGRSATASVNITVLPYFGPSVSRLTVVRCNADGTENPVTGTSLKVTPVFSYAPINNGSTPRNILTSTLSYKSTTASEYITGATGLTSGTSVVIAQNAALISNSYDVKLELSDSVGTSFAYEVVAGPVSGFAIGLRNDRARFGGPVEKAGLQVDWNAEFNKAVDITQRRCVGVISQEGWYRILEYSASTAQVAGGRYSMLIDLVLCDLISETHRVTIETKNQVVSFNSERSSLDGSLNFDKVRYMRNGTLAYIDVHHTGATSRTEWCYFNVFCAPVYQENIVSMNFLNVVDAPAGETLIATYAFRENTDPVDISSEFAFNSTGVSIASSNVVAWYDPITRRVSVDYALRASAAFSTSTTFLTCANSDYYIKTQTDFPAMVYNGTSKVWEPYFVKADIDGTFTQKLSANATKVLGHIEYYV